MKLLKITSSDFVYKFNVYVAKLSGFAFFSLKSSGTNEIEFHQSWVDYVLFTLSLSFSCYAFLSGSSNKSRVQLNLQSTILNLGVVTLWLASMVSVIVTKLLNIFLGRRIFQMIVDFRWINQKVKLNRN